MEVCSFTDLRERLDQVHRARVPMLITRQNATAAVVLDNEDYDSNMETLHLLRSAANATRLLTSIAAADAGRTVARDMMEP